MKNIIKYIPITLITLTLTLSSCLELLDEMPQSFVRVYGKEGGSWPMGLIRRSNGNLLVFGESRKFAFKNGDEISLPIILETDELGNQIQFRHYAIVKGEFKMFLSLYDSLFVDFGLDPYFGTNEFVSTRILIYDLEELNNGHFFAVGRILFQTLTGIDYGNSFYLLLDAKLNPIKWDYFNDSERENPRVFESFIIEKRVIQVLSSGDILCLMYLHMDWGKTEGEPQGYAIYKFSSSGEILNIWKYFDDDLFNVGTRGHSMVVNDDGTLDVVVSDYNRNINNYNMRIHEIDYTTWNLIKERKYGRGGGLDLAPHENGLVAKVLSRDPESDYFGWGSLLYLNNDLDSVKFVIISEFNNIAIGSISPFISTRDGGIVSGFKKNIEGGGGSVLIKTDREGNVEWRHETKDNTLITGAVEMDDGGIVYSMYQYWDGITRRITLVKLTRNGKL